MQKNDIMKIIGEVFQNYDNLDDKTDTKAFVQKQLDDYDVFQNKEESQKTAHDICETIDAIDASFASFQELRRFRKQGKERSLWFEEQLEQVVDEIPEDKRTEFIQRVQSALTSSLEKPFENTTYEKPPGISKPLKNNNLLVPTFYVGMLYGRFASIEKKWEEAVTR